MELWVRVTMGQKIRRSEQVREVKQNAPECLVCFLGNIIKRMK
jgi:hypothetical protein